MARAIPWEQVARLWVHPTRIQVLEYMAQQERPRSPLEASRELGLGLSTVSYHVKVMHEAGLLRLVDTAQRRGAVEHFYEFQGQAP